MKKRGKDGHPVYREVVGPTAVGAGFLIGLIMGVTAVILLFALIGSANASPFSSSESREIDNCMADVIQEYSPKVDTYGGYAVFHAITVDVGWCVWRVTYGPGKEEYLSFFGEYSRDYPTPPIFEHEF